MLKTRVRIEWLTLVLITGCYLVWLLLTFAHPDIPWWFLLPMLVITLSFHSSLQHEIIHGHPTPWTSLNEMLAHPPLELYLPYMRYRDTHRQHHTMEHLTFPDKDPESYYLAPEEWAHLPDWQQRIMAFNNTLLGRLLIGPLLSVLLYLRGDIRRMLAGEKPVTHAWLAWLPAVAGVIAWLVYWQFPVWLYALACYGAIALTSIRTFAEHRAIPEPTQRCLIVEASSLLSLLYLDNSLHAVHHQYPGLPWYQLRPTYWRERDVILARNGGYFLRDYRELFLRYLMAAKEPVAHPLP